MPQPWRSSVCDPKVVEHQGRFVPVMNMPPLQGIMALGDLTGRTLTFSTRKGAADALGLE